VADLSNKPVLKNITHSKEGEHSMPWCQKCKTEYRGGVTRCSDCGSELVEVLQQIEEYPKNDSESFLMSVRDRIEADIVEGFLNSNGIPVLRKYKGAGAFVDLYLGISYTGVDLYVPRSMLEHAKEILSGHYLVSADE